MVQEWGNEVTNPGELGDAGPSDVGERRDVLAGHSVVGAHRPLTCRWPLVGDPVGAVVFCHGLGSSGAEYAQLSRFWARHGYLVIHPTFADSIQVVARAEPMLGLAPGADLSGWSAMPEVRARMHEILHAPSYWLQRIEIVGAVMQSLPQIAELTLGSRARPIPCAIAGHSFGAYTAQLLAGAEIDLPAGRTGRFRDERFAAAVLLSAQGRDQQGLRDDSWSAMDGPVLTLTGTLDRGAKGGDWQWKAQPYEASPAGGKYLVVLEDGDHYLGGFADYAGQRQVPGQREVVKQVTLAFLDAYLRGSHAARGWLDSTPGNIAGCPVMFKRK